MKLYVMNKGGPIGTPFDGEWCQTEGEPFNVASFEEIVDREFFLSVLWGKAEMPGTLSEIVSRSPGHMHAYLLGDLRRIEYAESRKSLNEELKPEQIFQSYIFWLKDMELPRNSAPALSGIVQEYEPIIGQLSGEKKEVILYFKETPYIKLKSITSFKKE